MSVCIHTLSSSIGGLTAAKLLHQSLLNNIIHLPVTTFFDVTPVGRILARFSSDVHVLDAVLPHLLHMWLPNLLRVSNLIQVLFLMIVKIMIIDCKLLWWHSFMWGGVLWLGNGIARCLYDSNKNLLSMKESMKFELILHFWCPVLKRILVAHSLWCICSICFYVSNCQNFIQALSWKVWQQDLPKIEYWW